MEMRKHRPDELDPSSAKFAALSDEYQRNMSILRRSHERELSLLNAEDLAALFRKMTEGLRSSYGLDKVTVVLKDTDHDVRHLLVAGSSEPHALPDLQFVEALAGIAPQYIALRRPWLGAYKASDHSLLFPGKSNIRSMAMIPLRDKGALLGSINFGSLVCLMLDIDHFKNVNDIYGHAAGDAVLRELAQRIESQVRVSDIAARYGGEEFVVLLPGTEIESGKLLAERIRRAVSAKPTEIGGGDSITITAPIGIASITPARDIDDLKTAGESLLARADVALYSAKSAGRDQVATEQAELRSATGEASP